MVSASLDPVSASLDLISTSSITGDGARYP